MATNFVRDGKKMQMPTANGAEAGDAYVVGGYLPCVLLTDAATASPYNATVQTEGVFSLSVNGDSSAVGIGDMLYWTDKDTPLHKDSSEDPFGIALEATTHATAAINVLLTPKATIPASVDTSDLAAGALAATTAGRAVMAADYFNAATVATKFDTDSINIANAAAIIEDAAIVTGHIADKNVTGAKLADAIQDSLVTFDIASVDGTDGTAAVTIQAQDSEGNNLAKNVLIRAWMAETAFGAPHAMSEIAVAADGLIIVEHLADADFEMMTDATGEAILTVTDAAGTVYLMTESQGVLTSTAVTITGP
jgi:predicted RecA/RadA family phage recombinase